MHQFTIFVTEPHKYQLWVYIYQARDLVAKDESGMNGKHRHKLTVSLCLWCFALCYVVCLFFFKSFMLSIKLHQRI